MKSKAKAVRLVECDEEKDDDSLADALLDILKKQLELDKKIQALRVAVGE